MQEFNKLETKQSKVKKSKCWFTQLHTIKSHFKKVELFEKKVIIINDMLK